MKLETDGTLHINQKLDYLLHRNLYESVDTCLNPGLFLWIFSLSLVENLSSGKFHQHLRMVFAPQVVRYVDLMESSIAQSIHKGFERERWEPQGSESSVVTLTVIPSLYWRNEDIYLKHLMLSTS